MNNQQISQKSLFPDGINYNYIIFVVPLSDIIKNEFVMKVFVVIATENTDPSFVLMYSFASLAEAKEKINELYDNVISDPERTDIDSAQLDNESMFALVRSVDGVISYWSIKELFIPE